jgi:peptidoglycan/xylan/chitin deacetylase (PgdA/CDA1 family)
VGAAISERRNGTCLAPTCRAGCELYCVFILSMSRSATFASSRRDKRIAIIAYHAISSSAGAYAISPGAFERQVRFLQRTCQLIRLKNLKEALRDDATSECKVAVTIDDAYQDFYQFALPVLLETSIPATVFVPTGYIGDYNRWDARGGRMQRRALMSEEELVASWKTGLVDLGSHSVDHVRMSQLDSSEMRRQAVESKRRLEQILSGEPVTMFSYPYGQLDDFSPATTRTLLEAGYELAVTTHWGTRNSELNALTLHRICFSERDNSTTMRAKIEGRYDWIAVKERMGFWLRKATRTGRHQ